MSYTKVLTHAEQNAQGWLETIREFAACLGADRDRLEELRDERESLADTAKDATDALADYGTVAAEDADEEEKVNKLDTAATAAVEAQTALKEWDEENGEELAELVKAVTIEGEVMDEEACRERIQESPLSVQVRGSWYSPGDEDKGGSPEQFEILLSTGGPALRIIGELDMHCQPTRAWLEHQDWGTPWTEFFATGSDRDALMTFVNCFYFGD